MSGLIPVSDPKTREEMIANARAVSARIREAEERAAEERAERVERILAHAAAVVSRPQYPPEIATAPVKRDWIFVATGGGHLAVRSTFANDETRLSRVRGTKHAKRIIAWVCRRFRLSHCDILSNRRTASIVKPRQLAMQLVAHSRHCEALSLPEIGRIFGGRDHTTVLHSARLAPSYQRRYSTEAYKKRRPNSQKVTQ